MQFLIYFLIALSPLPFASRNPAFQWFWVLWIILIGVVVVRGVMKGKEKSLPSVAFLPMFMAVGVAAWGMFQAYAPVNSIHPFGDMLPTLSTDTERSITIAFFLLAHALFFAFVFTFCSRRERGVNLIRFCGIIVGVYAAYGFIVYVSGNDTILWFDKWVSFKSLTSTFITRNTFAAYAGIGLQCLIAYAFFWTQDELAEGRSGRELYRHILETMMVKAWWLPLLIFLTLSALFLTNSRAGFATSIVGVLVLIILSPNRYKKPGYSLAPLLQGIGAIGIVAGMYALSGDALDQRLQADASLDQRFIVYPYVIEAIMDRPLTGYGLGTFEHVFGIYRGEDIYPHFVRAHNDYLELALTLGIPAASILVLACLFPVFAMTSALKYGAQYRSFIALGISVSVQLGLHSLVDFSLQKPAVSYLYVAVLAACLAIAIRCKRANGASIT